MTSAAITYDLRNDPTAIMLRQEARSDYRYARGCLRRARQCFEEAARMREVMPIDHAWVEQQERFGFDALVSFFWARGSARIHRDAALGVGVLFRTVDPWSSKGWRDREV